MELVKTFKEFNYREPLQVKLRTAFRNLAIRALSQSVNINQSNNWIRFPYYHHVFDDERNDFERQLKYLKNFGDFISMDDVCNLIDSGVPIEGRYFCVSFDDGYRCCYSNMMEITSRLDVPVIIYLPTDYIGLNENNEDDLKMIQDNLPGNPKLLSFLSWEQCGEMLGYKVSFGSHTKTHANLMSLSTESIERELRLSQEIIQTKLQVPCVHFACPWGQVDVNFSPTVTKPIAQILGYKSFATTHRGKMQQGDDLFQLRRDHLLAGWENYQLNYFFSK